MSAKNALGRGFGSLIPTELIDEEFDPTAAEDEKVSELIELPLSQISPDPNQPRRTFDETPLKELSESIKTYGVIQPIVVTKTGKHSYQIVAGERRFRASKLAGLKVIPALVRELSDQERLEASIIENVQREDLSVIEVATAYAKLRDQFNLSNEEIAKKINKSSSAVVNTTRLLKFSDLAKKLISTHHLSEGQVRPLIPLSPEVVDEILPKIATEGWSARKVEQFALQHKSQSKSSIVAKNTTEIQAPFATQIKTLESKLKNAKVSILSSARGSGKLVIKYKTPTDLEDIINTIIRP